MEKHIVFLLHGVGKHSENWSNGHVDKIKENCEKVLTANNLTSIFELEFVELCYGDILDQNMLAMVEGTEAIPVVHDFLSEGLTERNNPDYEPETNKAKIAAGLRDYALDVPTYVLNPDFTKMILVGLAEKVTETISNYSNNPKFSLLCHSLGTKVGFDLLHHLYLGDYYSVNPSGNPTGDSPAFTSFYQLASIPWVMGSFDYADYTPNNSHVRVKKLAVEGVQGGVIRTSYRIYGNKYDPIAWIGRSGNISPTVYTAREELDYIDRIWMHDFDLYLDHPKVYLPLVEDLCGVEVSSDYKANTISAYENSDNNISQEVGHIFGELKDIVTANSDGINIVEFVKDIKVIIEKLDLLEI